MPHFITYRITQWRRRPPMPRCADGSNDRILCHANLSYRVDFILLHAMATATTKWLRQQHLLAAISSSFISCRSKATTNSEEMSARHIASRDGNNDLSCACTQRCPTATTNHIVSRGDTNWLRQQHLLSTSPSCIHNVLRKSDNEERGIASYNGRQHINCVAPWQRLITLRRPGGLAAHPFMGVNARLLVLGLFGVFPARSAPFRACAPLLSDSSESIFLTASASAPAQTAVWPAFGTNGIRPLVSAFLADLWVRLTPSGAGCASSSETLPALFFRQLSWIRAA